MHFEAKLTPEIQERRRATKALSAQISDDIKTGRIDSTICVNATVELTLYRSPWRYEELGRQPNPQLITLYEDEVALWNKTHSTNQA